MAEIVVYSDFNGVYNIPVRGGIPIEENGVASVTVPTTSSLMRPTEVVNFNEQVRDDYNRLCSTGIIDHTWVTTWNDDENILEASRMIGLDTGTAAISIAKPEFNHEARNKKDWTQWKAEFIIQDQRENPRPFVWIDDEATRVWDQEVLGNVRSPGLIIQPRSKVGLTRAHILDIIKFAQGI